MKFSIIVLILLFSIGIRAKAQQAIVSSPDKKLKLSVDVTEGLPMYTVSMKHYLSMGIREDIAL